MEPPWIPKLARRVAETVRRERTSGDVVLVAHSGAGSLVPAVAMDIGTPVRAAVFVDAVLPHPGRTWLDTAPPELRDRLLRLAEDGRLPPWNRWFPERAIQSLLPDEKVRARFLAELPRLPLAYFEERAPRAEGWDRIRCGYVQLSDAYAETAREASGRGWPTQREPSDHLAMLTRPRAVAEALDLMMETLGFPRHPVR
jgi:hypothetical protein